MGSSLRLAPVVQSTVFSLLLLIQYLGWPGPAGGEAGPMIAPAVRAAVAAGPTRVILDLRITPPFKPEGDLPGPTAVEAQRQAIAQAQAAVLGRLSGARFALVRQYDTLPTLALLIDAEALARLEAAGDVVARILPDAPLFPQR